MKDSAFLPDSDPDATSARKRSPAEIWTSPNCTGAKLGISVVYKWKECFMSRNSIKALTASCPLQQNLFKKLTAHLIHDFLTLCSLPSCRGTCNHDFEWRACCLRACGALCCHLSHTRNAYQVACHADQCPASDIVSNNSNHPCWIAHRCGRCALYSLSRAPDLK